MKASKILHRDEHRIKVDFPFDKEITKKLKQIPDTHWDDSQKIWHIPYTKDAFKLLKALFPDLEYEKETSNDSSTSQLNSEYRSEINPNTTNATNYIKHTGVSILVFGRSIAVKIPKNELDTRFILSLRYSRWDPKKYCWIVPNYSRNLELLKGHFNERITELVLHQEFESNIRTGEKRLIGKYDLLIIKSNAGRLKLIFGYNKELTKAIKNIPYFSWNPDNKWWSVPFSEKFLAEIKAVAQQQNLNIIYEEEPFAEQKVSRVSKYDIPNYKRCPQEYLLKLKELRYSEHTLKTYSGLFEEFINYYNHMELEDIDEEKITSFLRYLVIERKVSSSYQNQAINAVKFYYERVLGGQRKIYLVDRPREETILPEVLNETEISELF